MLGLEIYVPCDLEDTLEVGKVENLLKKVLSSSELKISKHIIEKGEKDIKFQILWNLSVAKRKNKQEKHKFFSHNL